MIKVSNLCKVFRTEEIETTALNGVSFEIKDVEVETQSRFFGLVKKHIRNEVTRKYTINEPTLATLDRLSREWVEFAIDDDALKSADGMTAARTLARTQAIRCARVIAIAVLGCSPTIRFRSHRHPYHRMMVHQSSCVEQLTTQRREANNRKSIRNAHISHPGDHAGN